MGVVNVSPESFSGDGVAEPSAAAEKARRLVDEGADLIDVGGQSTRPGFEEISEDLEAARVVPAISAIRASLSVPLSVDAYRSGVVAAALAAGADIVNDIHGLQRDENVATVAAKHGAPLIVMHNQRGRRAADVVADIRAGLEGGIGKALAAGLERSQLIVDPGFGFGWTVEQNLEMLRRLPEIKEIGLPLLIGPSRKSTLGAVLDLPAEERTFGTAAAVSLAIAGGADMVRVHDVGEMVQVSRITDAVVRQRSIEP